MRYNLEDTIDIGANYLDQVENHKEMNLNFQNNVESWLVTSLDAINGLFKFTEKIKKNESKNLKFSP